LKVIAFNGSARKDGNTAILIKQALRELEREGIETELVQLAGAQIHGCIACSECFETRDQCCVVTDDAVNEYIAKMLHADGIILGSPTYFADITPELKALIDRAGMVARANGDMFQRKVGAAVVTMRRAGAIHAFDSINPGSSYWNIGIGHAIGEAENDAEGMATMTTLGKNMAWLLKKLHA
jgi:multimeric flavodoxin WrbA